MKKPDELPVIKWAVIRIEYEIEVPRIGKITGKTSGGADYHWSSDPIKTSFENARASLDVLEKNINALRIGFDQLESNNAVDGD